MNVISLTFISQELNVLYLYLLVATILLLELNRNEDKPRITFTLTMMISKLLIPALYFTR